MYYRIPFGFFKSLDLVNFPHEIDTRLLLTLENSMNILFKTNVKADIPDEPDAEIIFHDMPYISYPLITPDDNLLAYINGILRSHGASRTRVISSPYQQSFEINTWTQSLKVNFCGLNKQIEWLEISLDFDKSDQHQTVYNSYDAELATKYVQLLTLENVSRTYNLTGQLEYNVSNKDGKHWLYQMFVAYYCEGCSAAPLTHRLNKSWQKKEIILEMILMKDCILIWDAAKDTLTN